MSVLIECLTLVVQQKELDIRYPGGADAFLEATLRVERPPRYVCNGDPQLVNLSFYGPEHLGPCLELLLEQGFLPVEDNRFVDLAYVDQHFGPALPCDWLRWKRHRDGFTYAWVAGSEPGDMAAPPDWTPERSRAMKRFDVRDEPGRMLKLAEEDGLETWLDTNTGLQTVGLPHREPPEAENGTTMQLNSERDPERSTGGLDLDAIIRELQAEVGVAIDTPSAPHENSYVVPGTRLVAGEYPFTIEPRAARAKLCQFLDAGVTYFVDLTEDRELLAYDSVLREEAAARGMRVVHQRLPIRDNDVPTAARMRQILDSIDSALAAEHTVYVHCWGGVGRTGTVIGCHLVRGGRTGTDALVEVNRLFSTMPQPKVQKHSATGSPQTAAQKAFVRGWKEAS